MFDNLVVEFENAGLFEAIDVSMLDDDDLEMFFNNIDVLVVAKKFRDMSKEHRHGWSIGFSLAQEAISPPPAPVGLAQYKHLGH